jgi:hypothetical protein
MVAMHSGHWILFKAYFFSDILESGQFTARGTENSTFCPADAGMLAVAVEAAAFIRDGANAATEFISFDASLFGSVPPLSLELLLMELVKELSDCLSWLDAVTSLTALGLVPSEQDDELSLILACLDLREPDEGPLLLSLGRFDEPELESPFSLLL